jgi:hypothetical protein
MEGGAVMKNNDFETEAFQLGYRIAMRAPDQVERICQLEIRNVIAQREHKKVEKTLKGQHLSIKEQKLVDSLNAGGGEKPVQVVRAVLREAHTEGLATLPIIATSLAFTYLTFLPLEWGARVTVAAASGISAFIILVFHKSLDCIVKLMPERAGLIWRLFLCLTAGVFGAVGIAYISGMRGDVSMLSLASKIGSPGFVDRVSEFYMMASQSLKVVFVLFALGGDIAVAVVLNSALAKLNYYNPTLKAHKEVEECRREMVELATGIKELELRPEIFESNFMAGAAMAFGERRSR